VILLTVRQFRAVAGVLSFLPFARERFGQFARQRLHRQKVKDFRNGAKLAND